MNPRLTKELRPLVFPWCLALLAVIAGGQFAHPLGNFGFFIGCVLLAVMPLGFEFENRTFALYIAQPLERSTLWREKLQASVIAIAALALAYGLSSGANLPSDGGKALLVFVTTLIVLVAPAALLTLVAQSVVGGLVFALAVFVITVLTVSIAFQGALENSPILLAVSGM